MEQTLAESLPDGGKKTPGPDVASYGGTLKLVESTNPAPILPYGDGQQEEDTGAERKNENGKTVSHRKLLLDCGIA